MIAVVEPSEGQRKSGAGARGGTTGVMDASRASRAGEGLQGVTVDDGGGGRVDEGKRTWGICEGEGERGMVGLIVNAVLARWRVFRWSSLYVCLFHG